MAKYVPSKDLEELKPRVANIIHKSLGYSDPSLVTVIMNCITSGHDKKRMTGTYVYLITGMKNFEESRKNGSACITIPWHPRTSVTKTISVSLWSHRPKLRYRRMILN